jgi:hypothetical protein
MNARSVEQIPLQGRASIEKARIAVRPDRHRRLLRGPGLQPHCHAGSRTAERAGPARGGPIPGLLGFRSAAAAVVEPARIPPPHRPVALTAAFARADERVARREGIPRDGHRSVCMREETATADGDARRDQPPTDEEMTR